MRINRVLLVILVLLAGRRPLAAESSTDANKAVARKFLAATAAADGSALRSLLAPAARTTLVVAGIYSPELHAFPQGLQWNRDELVQRDMAFNRGLRDGFSLKVISLIGEGDAVAAEVIGEGVRAATGRHYVQHFSFHWVIRGGRILGIRYYEDTLHDWDIWCNPGPPVAGLGLAGVSGPAPVVGPVAGGSPADDPEEDKAIVDRFLLSVPTQDPLRTLATWAPDGVWSFAMGGDYLPAARTFQGAPHWVRDAMIRMQQKGQKGFKEPLTLDIYSLIAENGEVSAEAIGILVRPDGHAYRQHYSFHFELRSGRIAEGHVYQDTLHQYDLSVRRPVYAPVAAPLEGGGEAPPP